jgi:hypothetical protein
VDGARFFSLLIVAILTIEFLITAVVDRVDAAVVISLVVIPEVILVIWIIAGVLWAVLLLARWLWAKSQDQVRRALRWTGARSGVWDERLDGSNRV